MPDINRLYIGAIVFWDIHFKPMALHPLLVVLHNPPHIGRGRISEIPTAPAQQHCSGTTMVVESFQLAAIWKRFNSRFWWPTASCHLQIASRTSQPSSMNALFVDQSGWFDGGRNHFFNNSSVFGFSPQLLWAFSRSQPEKEFRASNSLRSKSIECTKGQRAEEAMKKQAFPKLG